MIFVCHRCGKRTWSSTRLHPECARALDAAIGSVRALATEIAVRGGEVTAMRRAIADGALGAKDARSAALAALQDAVRIVLEDGVMSIEEEDRLRAYADSCGFTKDAEDAYGVLRRIDQASILRELEADFPGDPYDVEVPFRMQKSEQLVWAWDSVDFYEEKIERVRVTTGSNSRVRVTKGWYVGSSSSESHVVEYQYMDLKDEGCLGVSTKHVYFAGRRAFKIPFSKIVALDLFSEEIAVHKDVAQPKPQHFWLGTDRAWFAYNMISLAMHEATR